MFELIREIFNKEDKLLGFRRVLIFLFEEYFL